MAFVMAIVLSTAVASLLDGSADAFFPPCSFRLGDLLDGDPGDADVVLEDGLGADPHEDKLRDALLDLSTVDGSSFLRMSGVGSDSALPTVLEDFPGPAIGVGASLLNVLLSVNGLDHSLLALNRVDDTLSAARAMHASSSRGCVAHVCRHHCERHECPGSYCDVRRRCHCLC